MDLIDLTKLLPRNYNHVSVRFLPTAPTGIQDPVQRHPYVSSCIAATHLDFGEEKAVSGMFASKVGWERSSNPVATSDKSMLCLMTGHWLHVE